MNQYEEAIYEVVSILNIYDYDKQIPALGFGAKIPPDYEVSHAFPLSEEKMECDGVWGKV